MKKDLGQEQINHHDKAAEQRDHDRDERGGAFQFFPTRPGTFLEFLARFRDINGQALDLSLPPQVAKDAANRRRPNCNMYPVVVHKNLSGLPSRSSREFFVHRFSSPPAKAGGEGGIRTPVGLSPKAVFKTAAIDHSATSPSSQTGTAGGTRTPNQWFWRPLLYQLSYRRSRIKFLPIYGQKGSTEVQTPRSRNRFAIKRDRQSV